MAGLGTSVEEEDNGSDQQRGGSHPQEDPDTYNVKDKGNDNGDGPDKPRKAKKLPYVRPACTTTTIPSCANAVGGSSSTLSFDKFGVGQPRFQIPHANREEMVRNALRRIPKEQVKDPDSDLGKMGLEWWKRSKIPPYEERVKARKVRSQEYFSIMPSHVKKQSCQLDTRPPIKKQPAPTLLFDQPVGD